MSNMNERRIAELRARLRELEHTPVSSRAPELADVGRALADAVAAGDVERAAGLFPRREVLSLIVEGENKKLRAACDAERAMLEERLRMIVEARDFDHRAANNLYVRRLDAPIQQLLVEMARFPSSDVDEQSAGR